MYEDGRQAHVVELAGVYFSACVASAIGLSLYTLLIVSAAKRFVADVRYETRHGKDRRLFFFHVFGEARFRIF